MLRNTVYLWVQQRKDKKHVDFWVRVQGLRVVEIIRVVGKVIRVGELQVQNKLELFVTSSRQIHTKSTSCSTKVTGKVRERLFVTSLRQVHTKPTSCSR
jgi:hypothetical protein